MEAAPGATTRRRGHGICSSPMDVLEHLLRSPPSGETVASLAAWFGRLATCPFERPLDRALWAGFEADRLGFAFVGGYRAALDRLMTHAAEADRTSRPLTTILGRRGDWKPVEGHAVRLAAGDIEPVVVDNAAWPPHHRAGYNGIASLTHKAEPHD